MKNRLTEEEKAMLRQATMPKSVFAQRPVGKIESHEAVMSKVLGEIQAVFG
jgi:hypothetical protein